MLSSTHEDDDMLQWVCDWKRDGGGARRSGEGVYPGSVEVVLGA
jgi:hypothetical protein